MAVLLAVPEPVALPLGGPAGGGDCDGLNAAGGCVGVSLVALIDGVNVPLLVAVPLPVGVPDGGGDTVASCVLLAVGVCDGVAA